MNKFVPVALLATLVTFAVAPVAFAGEPSQAAVADAGAAAPVAVSAGKMLYGANGQRIAAVYRVTASGNAQIILNGQLYTVPASTLSDVNGKVTTSLTKADITKR